jgi:hypothetical protein
MMKIKCCEYGPSSLLVIIEVNGESKSYSLDYRCVEGQDQNYYNLQGCQNWAANEVCRMKKRLSYLKQDQANPVPWFKVFSLLLNSLHYNSFLVT